MKYEAIRENMPLFDVKRMCEVLGVKRSNYYRWVKKQTAQSGKKEKYRIEVKLVEEIFESSDRIWGYRNIYREIQERGMQMSEYRVRKIMRENGFYPELAVKFKPSSNGKADGRYYKDKVQQEFGVKEKNRIWAGDITYIKTLIGWVYLAIIMDLLNREIIGYAMSKQINTELVKRALGNAIGRRGVQEGLIFHSDYAEEKTMPKFFGFA